MVCPHCRTPNPEGTHVCFKCSTPIDLDNATMPLRSSPRNPDTDITLDVPSPQATSWASPSTWLEGAPAPAPTAVAGLEDVFRAHTGGEESAVAKAQPQEVTM